MATEVTTDTNNMNVYPDTTSLSRLNQYDYYMRLLLGDHHTAFNIKVDDKDYNKIYSQLRYVKVNFAGMISKVCADMLFSEPITVKDEDKKNQKFIEALWHENKMDMQLYESALTNSAIGDALLKVRAGKRNTKSKDSTAIIEDITPRIYYPQVDEGNVRAEPEKQTLAWIVEFGVNKYLRKEIHTYGMIYNELYQLDGGTMPYKIVAKVPMATIPALADVKPEVPTGIDQSLLMHVPNWKTNDRYFGISDYADIDNLFYATNHRMSQIDNILDKHGDPILMVPDGILDKKGNVNKKALGVIEMVEGETNKPEYIVWDASLENAFKYIEKLVEFIYLVGEISPDILGLGEGVTDSGRALKFKLMRTIAKVARKKLYYDYAIKQAIYVAELMAKEHGLIVGGERYTGEPKIPEIMWADGLPIDNSESIQNEVIAVDAGLTSKKDAIMRVYSVDEDTADKMLETMKNEDKVELPKTTVGNNPFAKGNADEDDEDGADDATM